MNEHKFAKEQAQLLFERRIEEGRISDNLDHVPVEYIDQIIDDPAHIPLMKAAVEKDILDIILKFPQHSKDAAGNFIVTEDIYDCWYCVDSYIENLWDEQEEAIRQARIKVKFKVWVEVEKIETDDEEDSEDYIDMECPVGISYVDTLEEAVELQNQIVTTFGTIN